MVDHSLDANLATPGAALLRWLGLAIAAVVAAIGAGLGFWQGLPAQQVIFYTAATIALVLWIWNAFLVRLMAEIVSRSRMGQLLFDITHGVITEIPGQTAAKAR